MARKPKHPMQPMEFDRDGVLRFKKNAIIDWLFNTGRLDLNLIAATEFSDEDQRQLAQLLGYSVSGYGDLSYVSRKHISDVDALAAEIPEPCKRRKPSRVGGMN